MPQSRQCSMRSSGELVPKSDGRIGGGGERAGGGGGGGGDREGGGGGGTAFKTKLEIKSSHSSHQRLLGSNSVSPQLFLLASDFATEWLPITFHSHRCTAVL